MNQLINDVQIVILSYLRPKDIIMFGDSAEEHQTILDELSIHNGFVVHCHEVVSQWVIDWFQEHNIQLKLMKEYVRIENSNGLYNGYEKWFQNGELHRDNDLPAIIWEDGTQFWYQNGQRHRDNNLPAVISKCGNRIWYNHGRRITISYI